MGANERIQRLDKDKIIPEDLAYAREAMAKLEAQEEVTALNQYRLLKIFSKHIMQC